MFCYRYHEKYDSCQYVATEAKYFGGAWSWAFQKNSPYLPLFNYQFMYIFAVFTSIYRDCNLGFYEGKANRKGCPQFCVMCITRISPMTTCISLCFTVKCFRLWQTFPVWVWWGPCFEVITSAAGKIDFLLQI